MIWDKRVLTIDLDNTLAYFKQFQEVSHDPTHPLTKFGNSYIGLERFYEDAKAGTLPMVSWIVGR